MYTAPLASCSGRTGLGNCSGLQVWHSLDSTCSLLADTPGRHTHIDSSDRIDNIHCRSLPALCISCSSYIGLEILNIFCSIDIDR